MKKIIAVPQRSYNNPQLQEMQKLMLFILLMSTKQKNLSTDYDLISTNSIYFVWARPGLQSHEGTP